MDALGARSRGRRPEALAPPPVVGQRISRDPAPFKDLVAQATRFDGGILAADRLDLGAGFDVVDADAAKIGMLQDRAAERELAKGPVVKEVLQVPALDSLGLGLGLIAVGAG